MNADFVQAIFELGKEKGISSEYFYTKLLKKL